MAAATEADVVAPAYDAAFDAQSDTKRHAACDECRKRKLKCSGEPAGCSRCVKQKLVCHYSIQKQMGRPKKRQKSAEDGQEPDEELPPPAEPENKRRRTIQAIDPEDQMAFQGICSAPYTQYLKNFTPAPKQPFMSTVVPKADQDPSLSGTTDSTPPERTPSVPPPDIIPDISYPTDIALWPDYSSMLELPQIVQDNHRKSAEDAEHPTSLDSNQQYAQSSLSSLPSDLSTLPAVPACPCLPNLYLTLSTLSSLNSFPITTHTITSLQTAQRTVYTVLHCAVCPNTLQSGLQNVVLLGTLLTVLADAWHRVRKTSLEELRKGFFSRSDQQSPVDTLNAHQTLKWQSFKHSLIRNNVFADGPPPAPPNSENSSSATLSGPDPSTGLLPLVEAMIRRQLQWHNPQTATGEFPARPRGTHADSHMLGLSLQECQALEKGEDAPRPKTKEDHDNPTHFCLALVTRARMAVKSLDYPAPRWGE